MFINKALIKFAKGSEIKIIKAVLSQLLTTFILSAISLCMSFLIKQSISNQELINKVSLSLVLIICTLYLLLK